MKTQESLAHSSEKAVAPVQSFVGYDSLDLLAIMMLPPEVTQSPEAKLNNEESIMIFKEGVRGQTVRSILSKDISASRMHTRYYQCLLDLEVERLGRKRGDLKLARFYSDLVDRQHRRLLAATEQLNRLNASPAPRFQVVADQAAFVVAKES